MAHIAQRWLGGLEEGSAKDEHGKLVVGIPGGRGVLRIASMWQGREEGEMMWL